MCGPRWCHRIHRHESQKFGWQVSKSRAGLLGSEFWSGLKAWGTWSSAARFILRLLSSIMDYSSYLIIIIIKTFGCMGRAFFAGAIGFAGMDPGRSVTVPFVPGFFGSGYKSGRMAISIRASFAAPSFGTRPERRGGTKTYSYSKWISA
jgi:hypothetical protein